MHFSEHIITQNTALREALAKLDKLAKDAILFVVDAEDKLCGALTDGDIRRGLIKGLTVESNLNEFYKSSPKYVTQGAYSIQEIMKYRDNDFKIIPVVDAEHKICNIINFRVVKSYLPLDAVIMAGGRGSRLMPLTENTPKPLLKVGEKPIIDYNIDRLRMFGVDDFWISINYLGDQLEAHFKDGSDRNVRINYLRENEPLGTIGSVSLVDEFQHDYVLVTNSDLLTNLDYEDFFLDFLEKDADMSVVTIPYEVQVPYAVLQTKNSRVVEFEEKPTYNYYSNGGIYLFKRSVLNHIPKGQFYNSTDLMQKLINDGGNVASFPMRNYWLDIGKHEDFKRAQEDIKHISF